MKKYFQNNNPESGFAFVAVILIAILLFSIMMVSGFSDFELTPANPSEGEYLPDISTTPSSSPSATLTLTPTQAPEDNTNETITVSLLGCQTAKEPRMEATATIASSDTGNIILEVENSGNYQQIITLDFPGGTMNQTFLLPNSLQFNTNSWRIRLVSNEADIATYDGNPTGC